MLSRTLLLARSWRPRSAPAVASAATDSAIVYVNDGDVWRVAPDGVRRPRPDHRRHGRRAVRAAAARAGRQRVGVEGLRRRPPRRGRDAGRRLHAAQAEGLRGRRVRRRSRSSSTSRRTARRSRTAWRTSAVQDGGPCNFDGITTMLDTHGTVPSTQIGLARQRSSAATGSSATRGSSRARCGCRRPPGRRRSGTATGRRLPGAAGRPARARVLGRRDAAGGAADRDRRRASASSPTRSRPQFGAADAACA